jgi:hypothetical protein
MLVKAGAMGGDLRANVTELGITYVRLDTPDGRSTAPLPGARGGYSAGRRPTAGPDLSRRPGR